MRKTIATWAAAAMVLAGMSGIAATASQTTPSPAPKFFLAEPFANNPSQLLLSATSRGVITGYITQDGAPDVFYIEFISSVQPFRISAQTCEGLVLMLNQPASDTSYFVGLDGKVTKYSGPADGCDPWDQINTELDDPLQTVTSLSGLNPPLFDPDNDNVRDPLYSRGWVVVNTNKGLFGVFDNPPAPASLANLTPNPASLSTPPTIGSGQGDVFADFEDWWQYYFASEVVGDQGFFEQYGETIILLNQPDGLVDAMLPPLIAFPRGEEIFEISTSNVPNLSAIDTLFMHAFGEDDLKFFMSGLVEDPNDQNAPWQFKLLELGDPDDSNQSTYDLLPLTDVTGNYVQPSVAEMLADNLLFPIGELNGQVYFAAAEEKMSTLDAARTGIFSFTKDRGLYLVPGTQNLQPLAVPYYDPGTFAAPVVDGELWLTVREIPQNPPADPWVLPNQVIALNPDGYTTKLTAPEGGQLFPTLTVSNNELWIVSALPTAGIGVAVYDIADLGATTPTQTQNPSQPANTSQPAPTAQDFSLPEITAGQTELPIATSLQVTAVSIAGEQLFFKKTPNGYTVQLPTIPATNTASTQPKTITIETPGGSVTLTLNTPAVTPRPLDNIVDSVIRRTGITARVVLYDLIDSGKAQIKLNGKEVAWIRAEDPNDPKLRFAPQGHYLVRTLQLERGKNVIEIYQNGQRLRRVAYTR